MPTFFFHSTLPVPASTAAKSPVPVTSYSVSPTTTGELASEPMLLRHCSNALGPKTCGVVALVG